MFSLSRILRRYRHARATSRLKRSLRACGEGLFFDDPETMTIVHPRCLTLGDNVGFNVYGFINAMGDVSIGSDTRFGPFVVIHSGDHCIDDLSRPIRCAGHKKAPIVIGANVWVGAHAIILRGSRIPDHCVIGAGTVVDRRLDLKTYDIVRGNPPQIVGNRLEKYGARPQLDGDDTSAERDVEPGISAAAVTS